MSIQKWRAQNLRELTVPQKVCEQLYEEEFEHFETIRQEIFKLITGHDLDQREVKSLMLKAYIEFSAISAG
jgi:hypothetical protein